MKAKREKVHFWTEEPGYAQWGEPGWAPMMEPTRLTWTLAGCWRTDTEVGESSDCHTTDAQVG